MGEQKRIGAAEPETGDISLLPRDAQQEAGAVGVERQGVADQRQAAEPHAVARQWLCHSPAGA